MRIVFVGRIPPSKCGISEYTSMLIENLMKLNKNLDIKVIGNKEEKENLPNPYLEPYSKVQVSKCFISEKEGYSKPILEQISYYKPEIVHIQHEYAIFPGYDEFIWMLKEIKKYSKKIFITFHTVYHSLSMKEIVEFQRKACEIVDKIIVHNSLQEFELLNQKVDENKVFKIPHGTLINPYLNLKKEKILEELNLELKKEKIVLFPGFLRKNKGTDIAINTARILSFKDKNLKSIIWGEFQRNENLEFIKEIIENRLIHNKNLIFIKEFLKREKLLKLLSISDIIVLPYKEKIYRFSSSGIFHLIIGTFKPIVCTKVTKLLECYEIAPNFVVNSKNPKEIANKIIDLINNVDKYEEDLISLKNYAFKTSWESVSKLHLKIYEENIEKFIEVSSISKIV